MPRPVPALSRLLFFASLGSLMACQPEATTPSPLAPAAPVAVQGENNAPPGPATAPGQPGESSGDGPTTAASPSAAATSGGSGAGGGSRPTPTPSPSASPTPSPTPTPSATPTPPNIGSSGSLSLESTDLEGLAPPLRATVADAGANHDPAAIETVAVVAASEAESAGETFILSETAPNSGVFTGAIPLVRRFSGDGSEVPVGPDGCLSVYAEGGKAYDALSIRYDAALCTAGYREPTSTLTGIVRTQGPPRVPQAGALLVLSGPPGFAVRRAVSRSDGSYAFYDVPSGTYWLTTDARDSVARTVPILIP